MSRGLIDRVLLKLAKRTKFSIEEITGSAVYIGGYGAAWVSVPGPTNKKVIGINGYYLNGYNGLAPYIYYIMYNASTNKTTLAIMNNGNSAITTTPSIQYACVDE